MPAPQAGLPPPSLQCEPVARLTGLLLCFLHCSPQQPPSPCCRAGWAPPFPACRKRWQPPAAACRDSCRPQPPSRDAGWQAGGMRAIIGSLQQKLEQTQGQLRRCEGSIFCHPTAGCAPQGGKRQWGESRQPKPCCAACCMHANLTVAGAQLWPPAALFFICTVHFIPIPPGPAQQNARGCPLAAAQAVDMQVGQVGEARQLGNLAGPGELLPLRTQLVSPVTAAYMLALRSSVVAGTRAQTCTTSRHRCLSACPASLPPLAMHISCIDQHAFQQQTAPQSR